jgi:hypothetical protein
VREKYPERQKAFDEVREELMTTLLTRKRQDVQQEYIKHMMDKYNVIVHASALAGGPESESDVQTLGATK